MNRQEPIPAFKVGDEAKFYSYLVTVLSVATYCVCCDRMLDEASYSVLDTDGIVHHKVRDSILEIID